MTISSVFDNSKFITRDEWCVTLCSAKRKNGRETKHAQILIEKITKNNDRKIIRLEIFGPSTLDSGIVKSRNENFNGKSSQLSKFKTQAFVKINKDVKEEDVRFTKKSETWLREAQKVKQMIAAAKQEKDPFENPKAFSIFGRNSFFSGKVEAFKIKNPLLKEIIIADKTLFKWLYKTAIGAVEKHGQDVFNQENHIPWYNYVLGYSGYNIIMEAIPFEEQQPRLLPSLVNIIFNIILGESAYNKIRSDLIKCSSDEKRRSYVNNEKNSDNKKIGSKCLDWIDEKFDELDNHFEKLFSKLIKKVKKPEVINDFLKKHTYFNRSLKWHTHYHEAYKSLLKIIYQEVILEKLTPDNCFTWAREKLKIVGVNIEERKNEKWWANTNNYLK